jgi:hypothetical protein
MPPVGRAHAGLSTQPIKAPSVSSWHEIKVVEEGVFSPQNSNFELRWTPNRIRNRGNQFHGMPQMGLHPFCINPPSPIRNRRGEGGDYIKGGEWEVVTYLFVFHPYAASTSISIAHCSLSIMQCTLIKSIKKGKTLPSLFILFVVCFILLFVLFCCLYYCCLCYC